MISFVVPAYNEEELLGATLDAIHTAASATGQDYEIVVADDGSSDRTALVARAHGARVVSVSNRQIAATRNAGAREASGDLLIFVDADTIVNHEVVRAAFESVGAGAIGGGAAVRFQGRLPWYVQVLEPLAVWTFRMAGLAAGCFLFATREAFDASGGFDQSLYGAEEIALSRALKRQGRFVVLKESVETSGRKFRAYSGWEILKVMTRLAVRGGSGVRTRGDMAFWYETRRKDPDA
ncbi:MAG TPA: glycosyltransferase [Gemmatimonadales bacterium]|nr:glycosyltransferase [Gemmatimonadales bacterium]